METQQAKRKLTAIFSADVKGYSRLMADDEKATVKTLTACREIITTLIDLHRGRLVDSPGNNILAEFASVVDAVQCAVEVQRELKVRNEKLPENRRMDFRIGVNLGDVIQEGDRIYGDGVNVAARLESLADGGGVSISRTVFDQVENKLSLGFEYLGEHAVKNIKEPVRLYRVEMDGEAASQVVGEKRTRRKTLNRGALAAVVVLLAGTGIAAWKFYAGKSPQPKVPSEQTIFMPLPEESSVGAKAVHGLTGHPGPESPLAGPESPPHERTHGHVPEGHAGGHEVGDGKTKPLAVALRESGSLEPKAKGTGAATAFWEKRRREVQDRISGVPQNILKLQSEAGVDPPSIDAAVAMALKAARKAAQEAIDTKFHKGKRLIVPDEFKTIQGAIDAAKPGDVVLVRPGKYFELIVMKDGVKLVSDAAGGR